MEKTQELFHAYLDESENSTAGICVVGGFVGNADVWCKLEQKWRQCLPDEISYFHATDCFTGSNEFRNKGKDYCIAVLDKLTDVVIAHDVWLVGFGIDATTYKKFAPKAKVNEFMQNKYAAPFGGVLQLACESMGNLPNPDDWEILEHGDHWEQCAFFIESNEYSESAKRTIASMRIDSQLWFRNRIGTDRYGTKSGPEAMPLLQVADLGAFLSAKHISHSPEGKISWTPYYEKLKNARRIYRTILADKRSLELLHQTHEDLKKEAEGGTNPWDFSL